MFAGMRPDTVFALLLLATLAWIAIPFIPAVMELIRPRDAAPLNAVGQDSGKLTFFATSFVERMTSEGLMGTSVPPRLSDGSIVRVHNQVTPLEATKAPITDVVVLMDDTPIVAGSAIAAECLARRTFRGGVNCTYRAILGQRDVQLGASSTVLRWVHANGRLDAAAGTQLMGRATSDREILLEAGVRFLTKLLAAWATLGELIARHVRIQTEHARDTRATLAALLGRRRHVRLLPARRRQRRVVGCLRRRGELGFEFSDARECGLMLGKKRVEPLQQRRILCHDAQHHRLQVIVERIDLVGRHPDLESAEPHTLNAQAASQTDAEG